MDDAKIGLEERLSKLGEVLLLLHPPSDVHQLLALLDLAEILLSEVEKTPKPSMHMALCPVKNGLATISLLKHPDMDIRIAVASCICQIIRIMAPVAPYDDELMKAIFEIFVKAFKGLDDIYSRSYLKRVSILETIASAGSYVIMLDLRCQELILQMFQHFFSTVSDRNARTVVPLMEIVMTNVLRQIEDLPLGLLSCLLESVKRENKGMSYTLGEKVIKSCATKLKPLVSEAIKTIGSSIGDYSRIISSMYQENLLMPGLGIGQLDEGMVGCHIEVWWPDDKRFYPGVIASFDPASKKHKVLYDDGDVETLLLKEERWKFTRNQNGTKILTDMLDENVAGQNIEIWCTGDKKFYPGVVASFNPVSAKHKVLYENGNVEDFLLKEERWNFTRNQKREESIAEKSGEVTSAQLFDVHKVEPTDTLTKKVFREVCIKQVRRGHWYAWEEIGNGFLARMGFSLSKKTLKRMWDDMRREYKEWKILKNLRTRLRLGDTVNMTDADEDWWKDYIKKRPKARKFLNHPLEFEEEYDILFSSVVSMEEVPFDSLIEPLPDNNANSFFQKLHSCVDDDIVVAKTSPSANAMAAETHPSSRVTGSQKGDTKRKRHNARKGKSSKMHGLEKCCRNSLNVPEMQRQSALEEEMSEVQVLLEKAGLRKGSTLKYFAMSHLIDVAQRAMFKSIASEERFGWLQFEYENFRKRVS